MYSLQRHCNNDDDQVTGRDSLYAAEYKVMSAALSLPKGKENNQQAIRRNKNLSEQDEGVTKLENKKPVSTARTMILREWII